MQSAGSLASRLRNLVRRLAARMKEPASKSGRLTSIADLVRSDPQTWSRARAATKSGPRVLIASNVTGFQHASLLESVLAIALTLRGADVHHLMCDGALPACLKIEPHAVPDPDTIIDYEIRKPVCVGCMAVGNGHFSHLDLKQHLFSGLLNDADRAEIRDQCAKLDRAALSKLETSDGDKVGMHGLAGALRYYARAELPDGAQADDVLRRFVEAAILTTRAVSRLLDREQFDVAVFHHGIYVPQGPAGDVFRRRGIRVVNWNPSYRRSTFIFSHDDTYHYTLMNETTDIWRNLNWSDKNEIDILDYLKSRATGARDWIWFHEKPDDDVAAFSKELGLDSSKPVIGMLSNVAWDAQLHYPANAFPNMIDWVFKTFDYFAQRPDLQLLLRIHPAEIRGTVPSAQPLMQEIEARYPVLPSNIFVIAPESNISTYAAMALCDSVIIYGTKTGVELTAVGKPVVVAGEAWIRNKGLTEDAVDEASYFRLLDRLPHGKPMDSSQTTLARKYAYHFFFRRMIPVPFVTPSEGKIYGLDLDRLSSLETGTFPGLDVICDGILAAHQPFVYEAERLGLHA